MKSTLEINKKLYLIVDLLFFSFFKYAIYYLSFYLLRMIFLLNDNVNLMITGSK